MRISLSPGTYVVATSGGIDSMVLLDVLRKRAGVKLIVAHFDHGTRNDSHLDRKFVQSAAKRFGLTFVHHEGKLGSRASEATARDARYKFLRHIKKVSGAKAVITAHHQDDVLETAVLNLIRGSGRRGLTSLRENNDIARPFLGYAKEDIKDYAHNHAVSWREDPSNQDARYKRNYVRQAILPKMTIGQRAQLTILLQELHDVNDELDGHVTNLLHTQPKLNEIDRGWFVQLPHAVAREVVHGWLRQHDVRDINRACVERLVIAIKTAHPNKVIDINKRLELVVNKKIARLSQRASRPKKAKKQSRQTKN